jgi:RNA polymerase sigma-70 factor (ECF subfamily)
MKATLGARKPWGASSAFGGLRPTRATRNATAAIAYEKEAAFRMMPMDEFFPLVYQELRRIAARQLRCERGHHTLSPTALVNEAWLELARLTRMQWQNRSHFLAMAAQAMRRILIDYAVARQRQKRGAGQQAEPLQADPAAMMTAAPLEDLMALDHALSQLDALNARHARVVECRFYGGMSVEETADALGISPATVKRDWTLARAWLNRTLQA